MKTITLEQLKALSSLTEIGDERVCVEDADGTVWTLSKESESDDDVVASERDRRLVKEVALYAVKEGTISTSAVQRKFHLGYAHASRIIDYLEAHHYISALEAPEPRKVFASEEQILNDFQ